MKSLSDKAGFLIVANFVKYAVGFAMPMVLARMLERQDYGTYQQLLLVANAATALMVLGLPTSVYYFQYHLPARQRPALAVQTSLLLALSGALTAAALAAGAGRIATAFGNPQLGALLGWFAAYTGLYIAGEHFVHLLVARDRYRLAVGFETGETVVRVLFLLSPLWFGLGLRGVVIATVAYAASRLAVRSLLLWRDRGPAPPGGWRQASFLGAQLAYSLPIAGAALVAMVGGIFGRAIVASHFTPVDYAIYAVGALEIPLDAIFQASVANVLRASLPALVRDGRLEEVAKLLRESVRKLSIVVLPSFVFLFAYAPEFITALFTQRYSQSVDVFRIYLLLVPLNMFILSLVPQVFGRTRTNLHVLLFTTAVNIGLTLALFEVVGFYGPAMATVAAQYVQTAVYLFVALRLVGAGPARLLPLFDLLRVLVVAACAAAVARAAGAPFQVPILDLALAGSVFSAAFLAIGALARVFTAEDRRLARRWLARVLPFVAA